jgi:ubiquinone/menaquinone biosynthesis C-methylase UbiE
VSIEGHQTGAQKKFDFSPPRPRPFLTNLPARIDTYEEGVAKFFEWRTGLNYYATIDQIADFVINTRRAKILDFFADTGAFALRLAGRKNFNGRIYSFDSNITLLERARQRARHLDLQQNVEFRQHEGGQWPVPDGFAEAAISIFDFHRHSAEQFLAEAVRILAPEGHLLLAEMIVPKSALNSWAWNWKKYHIRYVQKNPAEALGVYFDREELIQLLFAAGFRQVVIQGLKQHGSLAGGVFSLVAATK